MALNNKQIRKVARKIARKLDLSPRAKRLLEVVLEIVVHEAPGGEDLSADDLIDLGTSSDARSILDLVDARSRSRDRRNSGLQLLHALSSTAARSRLRSSLFANPRLSSTVAFLIDYD